MLKGVYLSLMIGPAVPVIAPKVVMDAITSVQVTTSKERNGFQITMSVSKSSPLLNLMLPAGYFDPTTTRVIIIATVNGIPNVLMDGLISNHQLAPSNDPGKSTLTITGEDLTLAMDLVQLIIPFPGMPDIAKVYAVLSPFAFLGIIPMVIPPIITDVISPTTGWQGIYKQTPLQYLKGLAQENGYIFTVIPGPLPGQSIGYFGPEVNLPVPQRALSINMDAHSNVEALNFTMDGLAKKIRIYTIFEPVTHKITIPIPVPNVNVLKPPMGLRPTQPIPKVEFADEFANNDIATAIKKVTGDILSSSQNPPSVTASGSLDVLRYNGVLRAGMMVGVRGAGIAYDGMYYVDSVTHEIKPGEYKQNFTLSRDGLISNTPVVIP